MGLHCRAGASYANAAKFGPRLTLREEQRLKAREAEKAANVPPVAPLAIQAENVVVNQEREKLIREQALEREKKLKEQLDTINAQLDYERGLRAKLEKSAVRTKVAIIEEKEKEGREMVGKGDGEGNSKKKKRKSGSPALQKEVAGISSLGAAEKAKEGQEEEKVGEEEGGKVGEKEGEEGKEDEKMEEEVEENSPAEAPLFDQPGNKSAGLTFSPPTPDQPDFLPSSNTAGKFVYPAAKGKAAVAMASAESQTPIVAPPLGDHLTVESLNLFLDDESSLDVSGTQNLAPISLSDAIEEQKGKDLGASSCPLIPPTHAPGTQEAQSVSVCKPERLSRVEKKAIVKNMKKKNASKELRDLKMIAAGRF